MKNIFSKQNSIWFLLAFPIVYIALYLRDVNREDKLLHTYTTFAVIGNISSGTAKGAGFVSFKFKNKSNNLIFTKHIGSIGICGNKINKGDTVVVKYSMEDNSIARIVSCIWNSDLRKRYLKK